MALDILANYEPVSPIPPGVKLSHLTSLLDQSEAPSSEMQWRWSVIELAYDAIREQFGKSRDVIEMILDAERRQRAANFLRLALLESKAPAGRQQGIHMAQRQCEAVTNLANLYRSGMEHRNRGGECDRRIKSMIVNMVGIYEPFIQVADLRINVKAISLAQPKRRALLLSVGILLQGILQRALAHEKIQRLHVKLATMDGGLQRLTITGDENPTSILACRTYDIAVRLLGILGAELVCRGEGANGSNLQITFAAAEPRSPALIYPSPKDIQRDVRV